MWTAVNAKVYKRTRDIDNLKWIHLLVPKKYPNVPNIEMDLFVEIRGRSHWLILSYRQLTE